MRDWMHDPVNGKVADALVVPAFFPNCQTMLTVANTIIRGLTSAIQASTKKGCTHQRLIGQILCHRTLCPVSLFTYSLSAGNLIVLCAENKH